jgi:hypothetical protein
VKKHLKVKIAAMQVARREVAAKSRVALRLAAIVPLMMQPVMK